MVKQTGVEINRRALQILHDNDVAAQVEFIMFEPGSTLDDLHDNLRFIEQQGLFGYFPAADLRQAVVDARHAGARADRARAGRQRQHSRIAALRLRRSPRQRGVRAVERLSAPAGQCLVRTGLRACWTAYRPWRSTCSPSGSGDANGKLSPRQLAELKLEFFALTRIPYHLMRERIGSDGVQGAGQEQGDASCWPRPRPSWPTSASGCSNSARRSRYQRDKRRPLVPLDRFPVAGRYGWRVLQSPGEFVADRCPAADGRPGICSTAWARNSRCCRANATSCRSTL